MQPLFVNASSAVTALGVGRAALRDALRGMRTGLAENDFENAAVPGFIGRVRAAESVRLPASLGRFDCRNHRIAWLGLNADDFPAAVARARDRHGAARIGVIVGTSTSGILTTELGYRQRDPQSGALPPSVGYETTHNFGALASFVRTVLALEGPMLAISTACSSSAKVFASAARWIAAGLVDGVVVGGVDSLCGTTLHGFTSLQLVSSRPCRPFDVGRDGLSLGEGGAFALLGKTRDANPMGLALLGYGESADAHHMSAPHPEGLGAEFAMRAALERAALAPASVDYVQAHGTATRNNDGVEAKAIARVLGQAMPVASIKGCVGHTLGAAGAIGAIVALDSIENGFVPGTVNTAAVDPECGAAIQLRATDRRVTSVVANAFGFGGNNACLVLGALG